MVITALGGPAQGRTLVRYAMRTVLGPDTRPQPAGGTLAICTGRQGQTATAIRSQLRADEGRRLTGRRMA